MWLHSGIGHHLTRPTFFVRLKVKLADRISPW